MSKHIDRLIARSVIAATLIVGGFAAIAQNASAQTAAALVVTVATSATPDLVSLTDSTLSTATTPHEAISVEPH